MVKIIDAASSEEELKKLKTKNELFPGKLLPALCVAQGYMGISEFGKTNICSMGFAGCLGIIICPTEKPGGMITHSSEGIWQKGRIQQHYNEMILKSVTVATKTWQCPVDVVLFRGNFTGKQNSCTKYAEYIEPEYQSVSEIYKNVSEILKAKNNIIKAVENIKAVHDLRLKEMKYNKEKNEYDHAYGAGVFYDTEKQILYFLGHSIMDNNNVDNFSIEKIKIVKKETIQIVEVKKESKGKHTCYFCP